MIFKVTIGLLILTNSLLGFNDSDLDGVEDRLDRCPNSGILDLVDKSGCSKNQIVNIVKKNKKEIDTDLNNNKDSGFIEVGIGSDFTDIENKDSYKKVAFGYRINSYYIFISDSNYKVDNISYDDVTLLFGYSKTFNNLKLDGGLGTTIYFNSDKEKNFFLQLGANFFLNRSSYLFLGSTYTFNSKEIGYSNKNYMSINVGYGNYVNSKLLLNASINYESKVADEFSNNLWVDISSEYSFSKSYYVNVRYSRYLKSSEYKHSVSINAGVRF